MRRFARRTDWQRGENALTRATREARARGPVRDLTVSNPTEVGLGFPTSLLEAAFRPALPRPYAPEPFGLPEARAAVAGYYRARGTPVDPERVVIVSSTSEAYLALFRLLADPGDRILQPAPSYPLLDLLADLSDVELLAYPLSIARGRWAMDPDRFAAAIDARTKAVVQVGPNNPTGSCLDDRERAALLGMAEETGLALISDEVFLDHHPGPFARRTFATQDQVLGFTLSGLSKVAALPQLKLAWIVASGPAPEVQEALGRLELILDTTLSVATPVQAALQTILDGQGPVVEAIAQRIAENLAAASGRVPLMPREGGWYGIIPLANGCTDEGLAVTLAEEDQVLTQPGFFFDLDGPPALVVSLLAEPQAFLAGVEAIARRAGFG